MKSIGFPNLIKKQHANISDSKEAIWNGLWLLLNTAVGELACDPLFGCGVKSRLFKANDTFDRTMIREDIYTAIIQFAPYVGVRREDITVKSLSRGKISVEIKGTSMLDYQTSMYEIQIARTV